MNLPALRSLADPVALQRALGLPAPPRLIRSNVNDTYDCGDRVLRLYEPGRSLAAVASELRWLAHLGQGAAGDVVTLAMPEGERFAVLFHRAVGQPVSEVKTEASAAAMGRALAHLHGAGGELPDRPTYDAAHLIERSLRTIRDTLGDIHIERLPELGACADVGPIHGDADSSNAFIAGDRVTLIDFDDCGPGPRVYDAACFVTELEKWNWPRSRAMVEAFLQAYRSLRPLDTAPLRAYQAARCLFILGRYARYVDVWGTFRLSPRFVDRMLRDLRSYCD